MTTNITKKGITVGVSDALSVARAVNGNPVVRIPATGATVDYYIPTFNGQLHRNGAMLNVPGNNISVVDANNALANGPLRVMPGDTLCVTKSATTNGEHDRRGYWVVPGRSRVDEAMAISFVGYAPVDGQFMVFPIGRKNPMMTLMRSILLHPTQLKLNLLPSVIDLTQFPNVPSFEYMEGIFSDFCGEFYDGWSTDTGTPDMQHPGYGRSLASLVSQAYILLCSTEPVERKTKLAVLMVQWGLDLAGAFLDGRVNYPNGGHMQGRKALIILAGHLLGVPQMKDPDATVGPVFQESTAFFEANPAWWFGAKYGWNCYSATDGRFQSQDPTQWTKSDRGDVYRLSSYFPHVAGCQVGTALGIHLMGLDQQMGKAFMEVIKLWMTVPETAKSAISAVGANIEWGVDFSNGPGYGMCAAAWRAYWA